MVHGMARNLAAVKGRAKRAQVYSECIPFLVLFPGTQGESMARVLHLQLAFGKCPHAILLEKLEQYPRAWEQAGHASTEGTERT